MTDELVNKEDVLKAYKVLRNVVKQTPLQHDAYLSQKYHANIFLKREDLQIVRSFKLRGAYYAISQLSEAETENGVICASAGNHAQGVAYTCNHLGIKATIFMPSTTPSQKIDQVRYFGKDYVEIKLIGDTFDESN
ncbi:MAG TPA: pyridoxal-phosphate dependent enzyme, partial [Trichococcus flocculiformis]|nr:pyridoxal-phosphate dependent enzyme [Trichococcus flocculiformis]